MLGFKMTGFILCHFERSLNVTLGGDILWKSPPTSGSLVIECRPLHSPLHFALYPGLIVALPRGGKPDTHGVEAPDPVQGKAMVFDGGSSMSFKMGQQNLMCRRTPWISAQLWHRASLSDGFCCSLVRHFCVELYSFRLALPHAPDAGSQESA